MDYQLITSDEGLAELNKCFVEHDAVLKEVHIVATEYIPAPDVNQQLEWSPYPHARLLVQVMWPRPSTFEFILLHLFEMSIATDCSGLICEQSITCESLSVEGRLKFSVCGGYFLVERILWREKPEWLGIHSRFGDEIPISPKVALALPDDWIICPSCADGWQLEKEPQFRKCPSCGQVCEIVHGTLLL